MSSNLEKLFNIVRINSCKLRKNNKKADGLKYWKPIKGILSQLDDVAPAEWKKIPPQTTKKYMSIPEYIIDGYGNKEIIEQNHFLIQQVRIPETEKANIRKIVQLGLNIGQFKGSFTPAMIKKFGYDTTNLDKLSTYISQKDIERLSKHITKELINKVKELAEI